MDVENPLALHYMMQDDLFLLKEDRDKYANALPSPQAMPVMIEDTVLPVIPVVEAQPTYMGKKGGMLILVHYAGEEYIHETHLSALESILKRKGISINDTAILNMAKNMDDDLENLISHFGTNKILILGEQALPGGMSKQTLNQTQRTGNTHILYSFSFDEMMQSPDHKKVFWEQMKAF